MNVRFSGFDASGLAYLSTSQAKALDAVTVCPCDVFLNITGASIGRVCIAPEYMESARVNQHVMIIRMRAGLEARYVAKYLASPQMQEFIFHNQSGATRQALTKKQVEDFVVPLPPLAEQRRIVARLERLEARIRRARAELELVPGQLAQARQSLLASTFRGELTADWRKRKRAQPWKEKRFADVCVESFYGPRFAESDYCSTGIPTIRTTDFRPDGTIDVSNTPCVRVRQDKREKFLLKPGDLLVTRTGSIGKMAVFRGGYDAIPSAYLIRFRLSEEVVSDFVLHCLCSPKWQNLMGLSTTSVTQPNINAEAIKSLPLPVPSREEQREMVRRVSRGLARLDAAAAAHAAAVAELDRLEQSLLARAFRGELVPQDPRDEPAAKLLARLAKAASREPYARGHKA